jgi:hypothetical protein
MFEQDSHEDAEILDPDKGEQEGSEGDDGQSNDNAEGGEDKKKAAAEAQKKAWLSNIREGKKTLEDMPKHLDWLKKDVEKELAPKKEEKEAEKKGAREEVRQILAEERAEDELESLVETLGELDISDDKDAEMREEYESLLSEFLEPTAAQKYKCLMAACKIVGIKDVATVNYERRKKGMALPPSGGKRRSTVEKDKATEIEKRLGGNLPHGY